jgi:predicted CxxxxCH...CXXCH cytochrome family protein
MGSETPGMARDSIPWYRHGGGDAMAPFPGRRESVFAIVVLTWAIGCTSSAPANPGPTGTGHAAHLEGTAFETPLACPSCHAPSGFTVDFSQNPLVHDRGGTYDSTNGTCAVYCHGNFTFGAVSGAAATPRWADATPMTCTSCHGMPPTGHLALAGTVTARTCNACHAQTVDPQGLIATANGTHIDGKAQTTGAGCTSCHGDATRTPILVGTDANLKSSPPVAPPNAPAYATGSHLDHVNPTVAGAVMAPIACSECHPVPGDAAHATSPPPQRVVFGPLATSGAATPTWVSTTAGCAASYCHGNFRLGAVTGSSATPIWTDTTPLGCNSCHGMPPTGHPDLPAPVTAASCNACHPQTVDPQGNILVANGTHVDGKAQVTTDCTSCHGDARRVANLSGTDSNLASSPPQAPAGAPAYATGAHLGHVNPTAASYLMPPIACSECHPVPADSAHATSPPPEIVLFGPLSSMGGATPIWVSTTAGCAASYCHGNFKLGAVSGANATPIWTDTTALTCSSCHGMPPTGHPALPAPVTAASCNACHPQTVDQQGSILAANGTHIDGVAQVVVGCSGCHGDASRTPNLAGTDPNLTSSPPRAPSGAPGYATGVHLGHVNPTTASYLMPPIACAECHPVPTDSTHAVSPPPQSVVFGRLATTGGAAPVWVSATTGCSASYCHGNFTFGTVTGANATPIWTDTTALKCVSCHAMPPAGHPSYAGAQDAPSCHSCHPQTVSTTGAIVAGGGHLNGIADGGACGTCHGLPPRTGRHTEEDHVRLRCDACHPTGYTSTTTVAPFHENGVVDLGAQAGYSCGLKGCPTGVVGTCTNRCHSTPQRW